MLGLITLLLAATQSSSSPSASEALKRVAARVPVVRVEAQAPAQLAGRYTGQTIELKALVGPFLGGEDLYLFPDGSYLYVLWGDVMPPTVYDKGRWAAKDGLVEFISDPEITWDPKLDRRHLLLRRASRQREIMLVAFPADVDYFETNAADNPELMLLIVGMTRTEVFSDTTFPGTKRRLMREAWNPKWFRKMPTPLTVANR